jgi:hypothetical protein
MRDPHVVSLKYNASWPTDMVFDNPPPITGSTADFGYTLNAGELKIQMNAHCATEQEARDKVAPFLHAWALDQALPTGQPTLSFNFIGPAEIIDRNPPPPGTPQTVEMSATLFISGSVEGSLATIHPAYPAPPSSFAFSPDVETLWNRYQGFKKGREPLLSMAYFCLSLLEGTTGGVGGARKAVCLKYTIDEPVRNRLGDLVSESGDETEARKFNFAATRTPLSTEEKDWIDKVIRVLIRRKGEYDANPGGTFPLITLLTIT